MKNQGATMDVDQYVFADFVRNDLFGGSYVFKKTSRHLWILSKASWVRFNSRGLAVLSFGALS